MNDIRTLLVDKIKPNPFQPRKDFDKKKLEELTNSIKTQGLLSPLVVRKNNDFYELACGERRFKAILLLKWKEVTCFVRQLTDEQMAEIGLTENLQRQDLNVIEEAMGYQRLVDDFKFTQEKIAKKVGKSRVHIANTLRILKLGKLAKIYLKCKILTKAHGEALLSLKDKNRESNFADLCWDHKISVKELRFMVKEFNEGRAPAIIRDLDIGNIKIEFINEILNNKDRVNSQRVKAITHLIKEEKELPKLDVFWTGWKNGPSGSLIYDIDDYLAYKNLGFKKVPCWILFDYLNHISDGEVKTNKIDDIIT